MVVMNILVSNLSESINNSDLVSLFSAFGAVSYAAIVREKKSGRSKGTAFLEMPFEAQAEQAIAALHASFLDGKRIFVQEIVYKPGEFNN
jgi:RNA recognition motif-containing protein